MACAKTRSFFRASLVADSKSLVRERDCGDLVLVFVDDVACLIRPELLDRNVLVLQERHQLPHAAHVLRGAQLEPRDGALRCIRATRPREVTRPLQVLIEPARDFLEPLFLVWQERASAFERVQSGEHALLLVGGCIAGGYREPDERRHAMNARTPATTRLSVPAENQISAASRLPVSIAAVRKPHQQYSVTSPRKAATMASGWRLRTPNVRQSRKNRPTMRPTMVIMSECAAPLPDRNNVRGRGRARGRSRCRPAA